ncbi:DUF7344 domain-containing protein [Natronorubrum sp. FCH18a]|uniref:DUF7344 domain-containing protein n=1 Tax=Natronorubrum sp. FCH18a TaxID=3447018 RepID=UPI003F513DEF
MHSPKQSHEATTALFEGLAHPRRRYAIRCLQEYDTPMALADLADEIAVREYEEPLREISAETVKQVYLSLYHTHIPTLAAVDCVRYSQERDTAALSERAEQFEDVRSAIRPTHVTG